MAFATNLGVIGKACPRNANVGVCTATAESHSVSFTAKRKTCT